MILFDSLAEIIWKYIKANFFFQLEQLLLNTTSHCTLLIAIMFFIVHQ